MAEPGETLSERELDVLTCVASGASNKEVAEQLSISPHTVKVHLRNIYAKLGASSRTEAVTSAMQQGYLAEFAPTEDTTPTSESATAASAESSFPVESTAAEMEPAAAEANNPGQRRRWIVIAVAALLLVAVSAIFYATRVVDTSTSTPTPAGEFVEEPLGTSRWFVSRPMPQPAANMASASIGLDVYFVGGESAEGVRNAVDIFNTRDKTWITAADKPTPVADAAAAVLAGQIYVMGGTNADGQPTNTVEAYSPTNNAWRTVTGLPSATNGSVAVASDSEIYLFGGQDEQGDYLSTVYAYNPGADSWRPLPSLTAPRANATGGLVQNQIVVTGGVNETGTLATCELLDIVSETWSECPSMLLPRSNAQGAVILDRFYVIGGDAGSETLFSEYYDANNRSWQVVNMPMLDDATDWTDLGVANVETRIYVVGGRINSKLSDANYVYSPLVYQYFIPSATSD
ncbi:MAG: LuxR C-terminal-related transcriptional regulator [Anaerolineae bacterium]|nr:LuxR C-terminal-related transcriptional regulator [Anaerolineae bacterium]